MKALWLLAGFLLGRRILKYPQKFIVAYDRGQFGSSHREKMLSYFNSRGDIAVLLIGALLDEPFKIYRLDVAPSVKEIKVMIEDQVEKETVH